jgi:ABC-type lipoprotein export system ATPase subunit
MNMIELENITKRFADGQRALTVLDGLSLKVDEGEFIAITGESGAGKTTLLNILGTLVSPDEGRYLIREEEVSTDKSSSKRLRERLRVSEQSSGMGDGTSGMRLCKLRNKEIGFVYQDHQLLPQFTVWQNILLPTLAMKSSSTEEEQRRAMELLEFMGIVALKDSHVTQLSGGEQTRVAICRALINQPAILLADEPTGQLDASNAKTIAALFQQVNTQLHTTIIMATHSAEMAKVAQKIFYLSDGKLQLIMNN